MLPKNHLVDIARLFIGVKEIGHNSGEWVERFQKVIDGRANQEPWCVAFVHYCVRQVDSELGTKNKLFPTEHSLQLWNNTPVLCRVAQPSEGLVAIWQKFDGNTPTMSGHVGIVIDWIDKDKFSCVEGNTSIGYGIVREGDGVYERVRSIHGTKTFRLKGFLDPWGSV